MDRGYPGYVPCIGIGPESFDKPKAQEQLPDANQEQPELDNNGQQTDSLGKIAMEGIEIDFHPDSDIEGGESKRRLH